MYIINVILLSPVKEFKPHFLC